MIALAGIDGDTFHNGPANTPAIAARAHPRPNTAVRTRGNGMPSIATISGSRLPARKMRPYGVRTRNAQSASSVSIVATSTASRYFVINNGPHSNTPDRNGGVLNGLPSAPQKNLMSASISKASANVTTRLSNGSLPYNLRISTTSTTIPTPATSSGARGTAIQPNS